LTSQSYEDARRWAAHWCQRWFLGPNGEDLLRIDGVDAGWATHVDAYEALLRFALRRDGQSARRAPSFTRFTKEHGFDRALRALGLQAIGAPLAGTKAPAPGSVAVVVEIPTPSMIDSPALVARYLGPGRSTVVTTDPRAFRLLERTGLRPQALVSGWRAARDAARRVLPAIQQGWAAVESVREPMPLAGRDVRDGALESLRGMVTRSLPWIGAEIAAVGEFLDAARPVSIALASDQHRTGRVTSEVAAQRGIPVVVLQHGLPQAPIGYLPVVASKVASWSTASRNWFIEAGTDPRRVEVLGNPRFDELVNSGRVAEGPGGDPRILLALSPTSLAINAAATALVLQALEELPSAGLMIKLHPGQGDWSYVRRLVRGSPVADRVEIRRSSPLVPLLLWADVTVIHRSTVAVDSLAAGKPIAVLDVRDGLHAAQLELGELNPPVADSPRHLVELILELARDRAVFFSTRARAVESLVGPIDGGAAARIGDYLLARAP
jgi:hypothetical protein